MNTEETQLDPAAVEDKPGKPWFDRVFDIDVRALAALRILLGVFVLHEVSVSFSFADVFLNDSGATTSEQISNLVKPGWWSLYFIDSSPGLARALLAVTGLAAIGMLIGFQTRVMTLICLVLVCSLQVREPLILNGGHVLLRMLIFWSLFLPMGAVWSLDEYFSEYVEPEAWQVNSIATAGIMFQMAFMYFFSGLSKCNSTWASGDALASIYSMQMFVKPAGEWMLYYSGLLKILTWLVVAVEIVGPLLMFAPKIHQHSRGFFLAIFMIMHFVIWRTLDAGIFPFVALAGWLVFIPPHMWNIFRRRKTKTALGGGWFGGWQTICWVALIYILVHHLMLAGPLSDTWRKTGEFPGRIAMISQEFRMFNSVPRFSPTFEYRAELSDGSAADIFADASPYRRTDIPYRYFNNQQWRRLHSNLIVPPNDEVDGLTASLRQQLLSFTVSKWNQTHQDALRVESVELICTQTPIHGEDREPVVEVWAAWPPPGSGLTAPGN